MKKLFLFMMLVVFFASFAIAATVADIDKAIDLAKKDSGSSIVLDAEMDMEAGRIVYDIAVLTAGGDKMKYKYDADTLKMVSKYEDSIHKTKADTLLKTKIDYKTATKTAVDSLKGSVLIDFQLESKGGKAVYEIELADPVGIEYKAYVNAVTGELISLKQDEYIANMPSLSIDTAKTKALAAVKGTIRYVLIDEDHSSVNYDVKIISEDNKLYDVKVDGTSGEVLRVKVDD